jgi:hypothetical protein
MGRSRGDQVSNLSPPLQENSGDVMEGGSSSDPTLSPCYGEINPSPMEGETTPSSGSPSLRETQPCPQDTASLRDPHKEGTIKPLPHGEGFLRDLGVLTTPQSLSLPVVIWQHTSKMLDVFLLDHKN